MNFVKQVFIAHYYGFKKVELSTGWKNKFLSLIGKVENWTVNYINTSELFKSSNFTQRIQGSFHKKAHMKMYSTNVC